MKKTLYLIIISIVLAIIFTGCSQQQVNISNPNTYFYRSINASESYILIQSEQHNPDFKIIDVRTKKEYDLGHLEYSKNINFYDKNFEEEVNKLDKNKTYLIYCRSGHRSAVTLQLMNKLKFHKVYNLEKGINSWATEGLPIETKTKENTRKISVKSILLPLPDSATKTQENSTADLTYDVFEDYRDVQRFYEQNFNFNKTKPTIKLTENKIILIYKIKRDNTFKNLTIEISKHELCKAKTLLEISID